MSHPSLDIENVDLLEYPQLSLDPMPRGRTLGDQHANAHRLIYTLIKYGYLTIPEEDFERLKDIYYSEYELSVEDIRQYKDILKKAKKGNHSALRLAGDVFGDRGKNSGLIYFITEALAEKNIPFTIIVGNHDLDEIHACEIGFDKSLFEPTLSSEHNRSLHALFDSIKNGTIKLEEILRIYRDIILPRLKLIDYEVGESFTIITHAPVYLGWIYQMAEFFKIPCERLYVNTSGSLTPISGSSPMDIEGSSSSSGFKPTSSTVNPIEHSINANTRDFVNYLINLVDQINAELYRRGRAGNIAESFNKALLEHGYMGGHVDSPLERVLWGRQIMAKELKDNALFPGKLKFIFGHIGNTNVPVVFEEENYEERERLSAQMEETYINLDDSNLGKIPQLSYSKGNLISISHPLRLKYGMACVYLNALLQFDGQLNPGIVQQLQLYKEVIIIVPATLTDRCLGFKAEYDTGFNFPILEVIMHHLRRCNVSVTSVLMSSERLLDNVRIGEYLEVTVMPFERNLKGFYTLLKQLENKIPGALQKLVNLLGGLETSIVQEEDKDILEFMQKRKKEIEASIQREKKRLRKEIKNLKEKIEADLKREKVIIEKAGRTQFNPNEVLEKKLILMHLVTKLEQERSGQNISLIIGTQKDLAGISEYFDRELQKLGVAKIEVDSDYQVTESHEPREFELMLPEIAMLEEEAIPEEVSTLRNASGLARKVGFIRHSKTSFDLDALAANLSKEFQP